MKIFYTRTRRNAFFSLLLLSFLSTAAVAQICGNVLENFNNTAGTTAGFTGDFGYEGSGGSGNLVKRGVIPNGLYTITTPTYELLSGNSYVGFGFTLSGTEKVARAEAVITYISTLNGQITNVFLAQFTPVYGTGTTATVCRTVDLSELPGFPANGRYRLRFELTPNTGSGQNTQSITFDDFRTNATPAAIQLPVTFIGFDARKTSAGAQLTWKVGGEVNVNRYEVERSLDGRNFTTIASISTTKKDNYTYFDAGAASTVYYRVRNVDNDGKYKYSSIARIVNGRSSIVIKAFPQPVANQLTVQHPAVKGNATLTLSAADGRVVSRVKVITGSMQTYADMSALQKGMYLVRFDDGEGNVETMKVVKQ